MKKILLTIFALALFSGAFAQFNQGRMLVGGSLGFSSITNKDKGGGVTVTNYTTTTISVSPTIGYFVMDNLAIGGNLTFDNIAQKFPNGGGTDKTSIIAIGPLVRYYVAPGFFGQGVFDIGSFKNTPAGSSTSTTSSLTIWSLGVGYAHFLNDHVAIEPLLKYQSTTEKASGSSVKNIDGGLIFSIGIQAYLGDRK